MPKATAFTGYTPTLSTASASVDGVSGSLIDGSSHLEKKISQAMRRPQFRPLRKLLRTLNGVVAGTTAVENRVRVAANASLDDTTKFSGAVLIETVPLLGTTVAGRATVTADQTQINAMIDESNAPTYVNDIGGNGAGANRGF